MFTANGTTYIKLWISRARGLIFYTSGSEYRGGVGSLATNPMRWPRKDVERLSLQNRYSFYDL
jgi:hypothetical protein